VAPRILVKWGARVTIGFGMVLLIIAGLLMLALLAWQTPVAFMLPIMISYLCFSLLMGACARQALAPFGEKAGSASALLGFVQMSGSAVIVYLLQLLPLNEAEQLALLMLSIIPVYIVWKLPQVKAHIMLDSQ
jgi:DHA1 family bicyclomycin/chloramphenicol resistance-like MFS transporter